MTGIFGRVVQRRSGSELAGVFGEHARSADVGGSLGTTVGGTTPSEVALLFAGELERDALRAQERSHEILMAHQYSGTNAALPELVLVVQVGIPDCRSRERPRIYLYPMDDEQPMAATPLAWLELAKTRPCASTAAVQREAEFGAWLRVLPVSPGDFVRHLRGELAFPQEADVRDASLRKAPDEADEWNDVVWGRHRAIARLGAQATPVQILSVGVGRVLIPLLRSLPTNEDVVRAAPAPALTPKPKLVMRPPKRRAKKDVPA